MLQTRPKLSWTEVRAAMPQLLILLRARRGQLLFCLALVLISRSAGMVLPGSTRYFLDDVISKHNTSLMLPLLGVVIAAAAVQAITGYWSARIVAHAALSVMNDLRKNVQAHCLRLPLSSFERNNTGQMVARVMTDVEGLRNLIGTGLMDLAGGAVTAILAGILLLRISAVMTLLAAGCSAAFVFVLLGSLRSVHPVFRRRSEVTADVSGRLTQSFAGVRVVKCYCAEDRETMAFAEGSDRLFETSRKAVNATAGLNGGVVMLLGLVMVAVMVVGTRQIAAGQLTIGGFVTFTAYLAFLVAPLLQTVNVGISLADALAGLSRVQDVLNQPLEKDDAARRVHVGPLAGDVEFKRVSFGYHDGRAVLDDVSFSAPSGTITALVGPSGAGKSTVMALVAAFYKPGSGQILVDGHDLSTLTLDSYRRQLGIVLQDPFLFEGSIYENVAFTRSGASREEVLRACAAARVDVFAERLPEGYDTLVGERGLKLSGGERQRVTIARALLASPRILILDEATSNIDYESEAHIQRGLSELMRGRTTFVIAHRLSTIQQADQVLVLEAGRIVERGTHGSLLALKGRYSELYAHQMATVASS